MASDVVIVVGLQGVGKSTYIRQHCPDAEVIDYEDWYSTAQSNYPDMDRFELPTYVKVAAAHKLALYLAKYERPIVVECTGMTRVNQAAIAGLIEIAKFSGREVQIVYLKPANYNDFVDHIRRDQGALEMFRSFSHRRDDSRWREPDECPYFDNVQVVEVDHGGGSPEPECYTLDYLVD